MKKKKLSTVLEQIAAAAMLTSKISTLREECDELISRACKLTAGTPERLALEREASAKVDAQFELLEQLNTISSKALRTAQELHSSKN